MNGLMKAATELFKQLLGEVLGAVTIFGLAYDSPSLD